MTFVDGYDICIVERPNQITSDHHLFFINLDGYKENVFEEFHYKILGVASDLATMIRNSKQTAFYQYADLKTPGGAAHIDDKYAIDIDEVLNIKDILSENLKKKYILKISKTGAEAGDELQIGYINLLELK